MKIVITGNMGYVGSVLVESLRARWPNATLIGLDLGFYASCLLAGHPLPERLTSQHFFADVRSPLHEALEGIDAIVHLAGISNDAIGGAYELATMDINRDGTLALAAAAKTAGVKSFVFASSCSVYGAAETDARSEMSDVNPLTAYARSKIEAESGLRELVSDNFTVTCLRFATACGPSPRIRLDLVLNDFVATVLRTGVIRVLSDGSPWRPLIDVRDMARAIAWAISRGKSNGGRFLVVNAGRDEANYQVKDLAAAVASQVPGATVNINTAASPDRRSYRVSFARFRELAPDHQPQFDLAASVAALVASLSPDEPSRYVQADVQFSRLKYLTQLRDRKLLGADLRWISPEHVVDVQETIGVK
jgi:nucleoside-diphosphate-sugar epimerase